MKFHSLALCSVFVAGFLQTTSAYSQAFLNRAEVGRSVEQTANTGNTTGSGVTIENSTGNGQSNGLSGFRTGSGGTNNSTEESPTYAETPPPPLAQTLVNNNHPGGHMIIGGRGASTPAGGSTPAVGAGAVVSGQATRSPAAEAKQLRRNGVMHNTEGARYNAERGLRNMMWSNN